MGLFDKLKESFAGDDKAKTFEVTFSGDKMGMTLETGPNGEPVVTQGGQDDMTRDKNALSGLLRIFFWG